MILSGDVSKETSSYVAVVVMVLSHLANSNTLVRPLRLYDQLQFVPKKASLIPLYYENLIHTTDLLDCQDVRFSFGNLPQVIILLQMLGKISNNNK